MESVLLAIYPPKIRQVLHAFTALIGIIFFCWAASAEPFAKLKYAFYAAGVLAVLVAIRDLAQIFIPVPTLLANVDGFELAQRGRSVQHVKWSEVRRISIREDKLVSQSRSILVPFYIQIEANGYALRIDDETIDIPLETVISKLHQIPQVAPLIEPAALIFRNNAPAYSQSHRWGATMIPILLAFAAIYIFITFYVKDI